MKLALLRDIQRERVGLAVQPHNEGSLNAQSLKLVSPVRRQGLEFFTQGQPEMR
jgi:hypothetical protein